MKILLLNPPAPDKFVREGRCEYKADIYDLVYPPLTLANIGGILAKDYSIILLDAIGQNLTFEKVFELYKEFLPDYVILNTVTATIENDLNVLASLKKIHDTKSILIGIHSSYFSKELIKNRNVDYVIVGEPELPIKKILNDFDKTKISGIVYKKGNKVCVNNGYNFTEQLDVLEKPFWEGLDLTNYREPISDKPYLIVQTARGCPYKCIFCTVPFYSGNRVRQRSIESVINEIKFLKKNYGINHIFFFADTFTIDKKFITDLCNQIIRENLNITFMCNSRINTVDAELLKLMKKAGCKLMSFGIENASQEILNSSKKGLTVDQIEKTLKLVREVGIFTIGFFILGLPGENEQSIKDTIKFAKKLPLDFATFYIATPFPGSELYEMTKSNISNDWSLYEYGSGVGDSNANLQNLRLHAYREFYLRFDWVFPALFRLGPFTLFRLLRRSFPFTKQLIKNSKFSRLLDLSS